MRSDWFFNPFFIYRNRELIRPYLDDRREQFIRFLELRPFKDRHRGGRCFIVGNGPSLTIPDLEKLTPEVTFAANKIYLTFDKTNWRPTYYVLEDDHMIRQHHEEIRRLRGFVKFVSGDWRSYFRKEPRVILYPRDVLSREEFPRFSGDSYRVVYCGYMVTYISLQLAYYMGFTRVYLIGVDFSYSLTHTDVKTVEHSVDDPQDHFPANYFSPGEIRNVPQLERAEQAMLCAKSFYETHGRRIWNATRGGKLEVFDRISLEEALEN